MAVQYSTAERDAEWRSSGMNTSHHKGETMRVRLDNGRAYELDCIAVNAIYSADHAGEADEAFQRFAPHVPTRDRSAVWFAVDEDALWNKK